MPEIGIAGLFVILIVAARPRAVALDQSTVHGFREGAENVVKDAIDVAKKLQPTLEM